MAERRVFLRFFADENRFSKLTGGSGRWTIERDEMERASKKTPHFQSAYSVSHVSASDQTSTTI